MPKNLWNLETHFNYTGKGTREWEGPVAPTNHQSHQGGFEPVARVGWAVTPLTHLLPVLGIAATPAGYQFAFKTRLGWLFGRRAH